MAVNAVLERSTFEISRELEFFSEKELTMQIGHDRNLWPIALLKELIDNALDACEMAGFAPVLEVTATDTEISVRDNGPGIPADVVARSLNYMSRISDKVYYVSPTRGQLGNALKTVWAAPFVASGERGVVEVWSQGVHHTVEVTLDRIRQKPALHHDQENDRFVRNGTFVKVHWPDSPCSNAEGIGRIYWRGEHLDFSTYRAQRFRALVQDAAAFNPHATFTFDGVTYEATAPDWKKWRGNDPTSAHWYSPENLRDLIAGYIGNEPDSRKTVREFVSEFRGLSGTAKQKSIGRQGIYLRDLVTNGDLDMAEITALLADMQAHSKPVKPEQLGVIGKAHLEHWMVEYAGVSAESVRYMKRSGFEGAHPYVLEVCFGIGADDSRRRLVSGLNWTATLEPIKEIISLCGQQEIQQADPVVVAVHIAKPRFDFTDRGKTEMRL